MRTVTLHTEKGGILPLVQIQQVIDLHRAFGIAFVFFDIFRGALIAERRTVRLSPQQSVIYCQFKHPFFKMYSDLFVRQSGYVRAEFVICRL